MVLFRSVFIFALGLLTVIQINAEDAAAEGTASEEAVPEESESMFSTLDYILFIVLACIGAYFLLFRKKEEEIPIPSYTIQPTTVPVKSEDSGFISKMKKTERKLIVFYGSQTGTAEEFAGRLAKEGIRYKMKGLVADPEECDMNELCKLCDIEGSLAVFCMATYGEGDPTDNAQEFFEWLEAGDADLTGLNYAVFALGNKTYEHFNKMGIFVDKKLHDLGGNRIHEVGLGDDDANLEDDFITWKEQFWTSVCNHFGIESSGEDFSMRQYKVTYHEEGDYNPDRVYTGEPARLRSYITQRPPFDVKNPLMSRMSVKRELHTGGDRSCMHIEFDIEGSRVRYDAGDHVAVYPTNDPEIVEEIGKRLGVDLEKVFTLTNMDEESSKKHPFPCPTTLRTALSYYVDVTNPPRTHVLKELSEYCSDPEEKEKLKLMASTTAEGKELYSKFIVDSRRQILHLLQDLPSCKPDVDHLLELLPRLQPRYYSISSSSKVHANRIHVTAVVIEYMSLVGRTNKGVATTWLRDMTQEEGVYPKVPLFVRRSQFRLPNRPQIPVIMIGPGTGLAPFRGFIQERLWLKESGKPVGETILYFGCRRRDQDFIYQEELENYVKDGVLKMYTAFSREQKEKVYVTHLLQNNAEEVWRLIGEEKGHVYICGDGRTMAKDVHSIITDIVKKYGKMSNDEAEAYVKKMEAQKRYSSDVWS